MTAHEDAFPHPAWKDAYEAEHSLRMAVERELEMVRVELAARPPKEQEARQLSADLELACLDFSFGNEDLARRNRKTAFSLLAGGVREHDIIVRIKRGAEWNISA